jgi:hypothetical protein
VALMLGAKDVPVPRLDLPLDAEYQSNVPALAVAPNTTGPVPHRLPGVVFITVGIGITVTTAVWVLPHPPAVPVTLYVVLTVGAAITAMPVVELNPVEGLHTYVLAPLAVNVVPTPLHSVEEAGEIETEGAGFTVTVTVLVFMHPVDPVPVTV